MPLDKPTNSKGYARLLLKHIFSKVRDTRRMMPPMEYRALAELIGLSDSQLSVALQELIRESWIALDNTTQGIRLTPDGVNAGDYWQYRAESVLNNDPLPESLPEIRMEIGHFAHERSTTMPKTPEWEWINGRLEDLRHRENMMTKQAGSTVYVQSGSGGRLNVNSTDNSVNIISISEIDVFPKLRQEIEANVIDPVKRRDIMAKLDELEQSKGTPTYAARFRDFIGVTADIMTIIGPFIQPLTALIK
jgi:hypothetical protein